MTKAQVLQFYSDEMQIVRSRIDNIPARVFGLTEDQSSQLAAAIEDTYAGIRGDKSESWDQ